MNLAISMERVQKKYKHFRLGELNLQVESGTVMGLIGPNGAGKSTTMRILLGLEYADSGSVCVLGNRIPEHGVLARKDVGYYCEDMRLYQRESIGWHMQFVQSIFPSWDDQYARQLLKRFGLIEEQRVKGLSHGQRVKALLMLTFARRPKLLILDEPTTGLDPVARHEILSELMQVVTDESRTILFSSHNTQDVEQISDSITFVDRGKVIACQNRDDFIEQWRRIRLNAPTDWTLPVLPGLRLENSFRSQRVLTLNRFDDSISDQLRASGAEIEAIDRMTLEEIFVGSVMRGREEEPC